MPHVRRQKGGAVFLIHAHRPPAGLTARRFGRPGTGLLEHGPPRQHPPADHRCPLTNAPPYEPI